MRSRYSAFSFGLADYLTQTWHPETRPASLVLDPTQRWTRLAIHETTGGTAFDNAGTVRFTASWTRGGQRGSLTETSRFVAADRRWLYLNGSVD